MIALVALVVLIGGAVFVAQQVDGGKGGDGEAPKEEHQPFGSLPPEPLPEPRQRTGGAPADNKPAPPAGIENDANWKAALAIAEKGWEHDAAKAAATAAGDEDEAAAAGVRARDAFNEAFEMTAAWEEELTAKYSERSPQIRSIVRTRNKWIEKIGEYRKFK